MDVLYDKEINRKVPSFSVSSSMRIMWQALSMKSYSKDNRKDDRYIEASTGEEPMPPGIDSIGRRRALNKPELVAKFISPSDPIFGDTSPGRYSPSLKLLDRGRGSQMSQRSFRSRRSRHSKAYSIKESVDNKSQKGSNGASKRRLKRSDSERKRIMEKKLLAYYQSMVQPVDEWGPYYEQQNMLDGTDVDNLISKKRAHKTIMEEAFSAQQRFKFS